ncbi:chromosome segregation and condensation protein ScpA [Oleiphilus messinensis]|uniref:Segregation and condensation protein A n=1 Tax=Oleiphilus messinensis TaxID=141451 RepID=A0A1Y0ICG2_9GAMM|nr:ScpA family protein [Oleiphilus messinensis]ARU57466.1 chromosome segregation and condensation protein ScpA [Oleiphilus messinensis]
MPDSGADILEAAVAEVLAETQEVESSVEAAAVTDGQSDKPSLALIDGKAYTAIPTDLYIPPDALQIFLESFEGPLDLLLYLIRKQNMDILNIDVSAITAQYMEYISLMEAMKFELAAEYLLMAATLAEIKSRVLLPRQQTEEGEEIDPRAELIRRLQQYERFKKAAEELDEIPRVGRDILLCSNVTAPKGQRVVHPEVGLDELLLAFSQMLRRSDMFESHQVEKELLSTRERMSMIMDQIPHDGFLEFTQLFTLEEGRMGVVVSFLAMMELIKEQLIEIVQNEVFGKIHLRARKAN